MNRAFAKTVCTTLVVATTALSFPMGVQARVVGTEEAARSEAAAPGAPLDRAALRAMLERADVREQLQARGVDPRAARERVDALTDEEVASLAGQVGQLPAGGSGIIGVLFAVFIILLVTDILGLTKVFPFTPLDAVTRERLRRIAAPLLAVLLAACAAPGPGTGPEAPGTVAPGAARAAVDPAALPAARRLQDVPFVAQPDWQCGPAALAIAMAAAGRSVPVATLAEGSFVPGLQGSLQAEMLAAPRRHGMLATELPPELDALRREVAAGRPVVVLQNLGLSWLPRWHYAVLVGYDLPAGEVLLHSGDTPSMPMRLSTFERTWARSGRWAIALTPPSTLPASAAEPQAVRAAIGLERADPAAAARAWDAIVERWPQSRLGRFGRANLRLGGGDAPAAVTDYRAALAVDPSFADAWNNLAQALAAAGRPDAARLAADRAVELGGVRVDAYRDTRRMLGP